MIDPVLEKRLHALEEFVANCFYHSQSSNQILALFTEDTDVADLIDPDYLDYLKELVERD